MTPNVNECPECGSVDIHDGRLVGDMTAALRVSECNLCGCEWHLTLKPDMLVVSSTGNSFGAILPRRGDRRVSDDGSCDLGRRVGGERRDKTFEETYHQLMHDHMAHHLAKEDFPTRGEFYFEGLPEGTGGSLIRRMLGRLRRGR